MSKSTNKTKLNRRGFLKTAAASAAATVAPPVAVGRGAQAAQSETAQNDAARNAAARVLPRPAPAPGAVPACHGTVGTQHATMGIYDCFCDRAPMFVIIGNHLDAATRRGVVDWVHSAQDAAAIVREFVKWDDNPVSLQHFADSSVRAYK